MNVRSALRSHWALLVTLCALWGVTALAGRRDASLENDTQDAQQEQEPRQEQQPPSPSPTPESRALVLTVTVVGLEESAELPVRGATVTVFAVDHKEGHATDTTGKATFKFTTAARTLTLRVVADEWQPHQQQLEIDGTEKVQKVSLRPSD